MYNGETGIITEVQGFTVHDGPGIRSMAFFKGCPLRCKWCQNPETWAVRPELMHNPDDCIGCNKCINVCTQKAVTVSNGGIEINRELCNVCGVCAQTCYGRALKMTGKCMTVDELYEKLMEDKVFHKNSGGGVTLSGGECTMQSKFVVALLKKLKEENVHTAIETCGHCSWENFREVVQYVDLVLFDIKVPDDEKSKVYTGHDTSLILQNLEGISKMGKDIVIRFPMIPGVNDDKVSLQAVADIAIKNNISRINILPFHQAGTSKWKAIGKPYSLEDLRTPTDEEVDAALNLFLSRGLDASVGGSKA